MFCIEPIEIPILWPIDRHEFDPSYDECHVCQLLPTEDGFPEEGETFQEVGPDPPHFDEIIDPPHYEEPVYAYA